MSELVVAAITGGVLVALGVASSRVLGNQGRSAESPWLPTYRRRLPAFHRELNRARRADRPLAVVVFGPDQESTGREKPATRNPRTVRLLYLLVGSIVRESLREHDMIAYDPATDRYVLLLVDSDRTDAVGLIARIREEVRVRCTVSLQAGLAQLPDDGLTIDDLVRTATDRYGSWDQQGEEDGVGRLPVAQLRAADAASRMMNRP